MFPSNLIAEDKVEITQIVENKKENYTKEELINKVYVYSQIYNRNPDVLIDVISCENKSWDVDAQSKIKYKEGNRWGFDAGVYEKSYGLVMIHLPDHPYITYEQAIDPDFAIDYLAKNIGKVKWTCYKGNS